MPLVVDITLCLCVPGGMGGGRYVPTHEAHVTR